jgi:hypothetical protein
MKHFYDIMFLLKNELKNKNTSRTQQEHLRFYKIINQFKIHSKSFNDSE